ncbi:hypothetical protein EVAR_21019_1 [Eumeta japonica]|uniref:Uncharacterized protein n=1 Tax=Eumeta variegata TaxID=151549 RepID=A0A4C1V140_EUMVA|nr:hypothetical protein EVAR_21019_1 [Eumeta japonica]
MGSALNIASGAMALQLLCVQSQSRLSYAKCMQFIIHCYRSCVPASAARRGVRGGRGGRSVKEYVIERCVISVGNERWTTATSDYPSTRGSVHVEKELRPKN